MSTPNRPPSPEDTRTGLQAILGFGAFLAWGLPLAIAAWRLAL